MSTSNFLQKKLGSKLSILFVLGMLALILALPAIVHIASFANKPTSTTSARTTSTATTSLVSSSTLVTTTTRVTRPSSTTSSATTSSATTSCVAGSGASPGGSISLSYKLAKPYITVSLSGKDSQFPSTVIITLSSYINGSSTAFNVQSYTVSIRGSGSVSYTFTVPYVGNGNYLFTGSVHDTCGNLLAQSSIDPRIDPNW